MRAIDLSAPTVIIAVPVGAGLAGLGGAPWPRDRRSLKVDVVEMWLADRLSKETGHAAET